MTPKIIGISGGKGGTGKSTLTVQLGILLSKAGKRVVIMDMDPNGSNLHTFFGFGDPEKNLEHVMMDEVFLDEIVLPTGFKDLGLVPGFSFDIPFRYSPEAVSRVYEQANRVAADVLLMDLGSGFSPWTLHFFRLSDLGLLVTVPEPTAVEKDIKFIRAVYKMDLLQANESEGIPHSGWLPIPWLSSLKRKDEAKAFLIQKQWQKQVLAILVNKRRLNQHLELHLEMSSVFRRFFGTTCLELSSLSFDERLPLSVFHKTPMVFEYPHSRWTEELMEISEKLFLWLGEKHDS